LFLRVFKNSSGVGGGGRWITRWAGGMVRAEKIPGTGGKRTPEWRGKRQAHHGKIKGSLKVGTYLKENVGTAGGNLSGTAEVHGYCDSCPLGKTKGSQ